MNPKAGWLCNSSAHFLDPGTPLRLMQLGWSTITKTDLTVKPYFSEKLLLLDNTISCPSAITLRNNLGTYFDRRLQLGGDCDFYWRLGVRFGDPLVLEYELTCNREGLSSVSASLISNSVNTKKRFANGRRVLNRKDLHVWEVRYIAKKYGRANIYSSNDEFFFKNAIQSVIRKRNRFLNRNK
jgi:hypothetical protein